MAGPRIAVVGAGPGGLLFARVLQRHGLDAVVYEADASVSARDAGGTLDLHADTGQIALEEAGLTAEFAAVARPEGQAKRGLDQHGTVLSDYEPPPGDNAAPEIDRGRLRALLAAHVAPGTVRWGHRLVAVHGSGPRRLEFADGSSAEADLVVGADGAWSRVRPLLTPATPAYSGVAFLDVRYDDVERRHPEIAELVGQGHAFVRGTDGRGMILQRNSGDIVRGYLAMRTEADWPAVAGVDLDDPVAVGEHLLGEFTGWAPQLRRLLTEIDGPVVNRAIHVLPAPLRWDPVPGATLLGDAAHVMAPFGGHGVNLAMLEGAELAIALAQEPTTDAAVRRYEKAMMDRSGPLAVDANEGLQRFFAVGVAAHDGPDPAEEHRRYEQGAAAYRAQRAAQS